MLLPGYSVHVARSVVVFARHLIGDLGALSSVASRRQLARWIGPLVDRAAALVQSTSRCAFSMLPISGFGHTHSSITAAAAAAVVLALVVVLVDVPRYAYLDSVYARLCQVQQCQVLLYDTPAPSSSNKQGGARCERRMTVPYDTI